MKRLLISVLIAATATAALAHSGATGIVKVRMDGMMVLGQSMKTLLGLTKTGDFDQAAVREAAKQIQSHSGQAMNDRFPEGSLQSVSEAAPAIWQDWDRFIAISDELFDAAVELENNAANADFDLADSVKRMGATCSACHEPFRIKK